MTSKTSWWRRSSSTSGAPKKTSSSSSERGRPFRSSSVTGSSSPFSDKLTILPSSPPSPLTSPIPHSCSSDTPPSADQGQERSLWKSRKTVQNESHNVSQSQPEGQARRPSRFSPRDPLAHTPFRRQRRSSEKDTVYPEVSLSALHQESPPHTFSCSDLACATQNRSSLIGSGGFGLVYKGYIRDTDKGEDVPVAVKILSHSEAALRLGEIMSEVLVAASTRHPGILKLLGYSTEGCFALVYEFMPGGDVDRLLRKCRRNEAEFPWEARMQVAVECAEALAFMQQRRIVHRDFKGSNVLLTEDLRPRIADFGLVKTIPDWHSHVTTRPKGSIGYMDPMYFNTGHVHFKSDVYSLGVFLVELVTGLSVYRDALHESVIADLSAAVSLELLSELVERISDPSLHLRGSVMQKQVLAVAFVARKALSEQWEERPDMQQVARELRRIVSVKSAIGVCDPQRTCSV